MKIALCSFCIGFVINKDNKWICGECGKELTEEELLCYDEIEADDSSEQIEMCKFCKACGCRAYPKCRSSCMLPDFEL